MNGRVKNCEFDCNRGTRDSGYGGEYTGGGCVLQDAG